LLVQTVCSKYFGKLIIAKIGSIVKNQKNDARFIIVKQIIETTRNEIPPTNIKKGVRANFLRFTLRIIVAINPPKIAKNDKPVITKTTYLRIEVARVNVVDFEFRFELSDLVSLPIKLEVPVIGQGPLHNEIGFELSFVKSSPSDFVAPTIGHEPGRIQIDCKFESVSTESCSSSIGSLVRFSSDGKVIGLSPAQSDDGLELFCTSSASVAKVESEANPEIKSVKVTKASAIFLNIF
jgi:hypothetical protein